MRRIEFVHGICGWIRATVGPAGPSHLTVRLTMPAREHSFPKRSCRRTDPSVHGNGADLRSVHVRSYSCFRAAEDTRFAAFRLMASMNEPAIRIQVKNPEREPRLEFST